MVLRTQHPYHMLAIRSPEKEKRKKQPGAHVWALGAVPAPSRQGKLKRGPISVVCYMKNDILSPDSKTRGRGEENEWK